jgi:pimeloyl-ACP methyl ester carboxylesterase
MKRRLLVALVLVVVVALAWFLWPRPEPDYPLRQEVFVQPLDHGRPEGPTFEQFVDILEPVGAGPDAPVFFVLGGEANATRARLVRIYEAYGAPKDVIFVQAEHRGYGESLSAGDQTVPVYVTVDQALADFHAVVQALKARYPGPWAAGGYSYSGGLVIDFAARYPDDVDAILSSSGVVDWPFTMDAYDAKVRLVFGPETYERVTGHIENLQPAELFDENWLEREFLIAFVHGISQYKEYRPYLPFFKAATRLSTPNLLKALHWLDDTIADQAAWNYAVSNGKLTLSHEEALTSRYTWRTWRYQQCDEVGIFEISQVPGGIFNRGHDDFVAECRALFGPEQPRSADGPAWSPRAALDSLAVPLVYVAGEVDPWEGLGIERDYPLGEGEYFFVPDGRHCPDSRNPELGVEVFATLIDYARGGQP